MLVSTIAITALVAVAVVGWRAVRGDGSSTPGAAGDWNEIALVNTATGEVTTVDADGELITTSPPLGRTTDVEVHGGNLALVGSTAITLTDLGDDAPFVIPIDRNAVVDRLAIDDQLLIAVSNPRGGDAVLIDGLTGDTFDIGELAGQSDPLMFGETLRHDLTGVAFAIADAATFQTIMIRRDRPEPGFVADVPVAIGVDTVATSQVVGQRADIGLYDAEGANLTLVPTEIPAGGLIDDDDDLTFVSIEGGIFRLTAGDETEPTRLGAISVPVGATVSSVRPTFEGERLVIHGDVFQAVIDLEAATIFTTTFATPIEPVEPQPGWICYPTGTVDAAHSVISLDTGEQLSDLTGLAVIGTSSDGCTVLGERAGVTELVTPSGTATLGSLRSAVLGPDGRSVVVTTTTGVTELWRFDDDLEPDDPVDLSEHASTALAVAFLDR